MVRKRKPSVAPPDFSRELDLEYAPFSQLGGLGKAYDLFGDRIVTILEDMNERLAA